MSSTTKSKIINKLKTVSKGAWKRAKDTEAKPRGGGGFPPNLKNVVAACQTWKMAETNNAARDPYFQLTGIVKDPEDLVGRRATFMWFINESEWATVEDNLNQLSNDLQLLGLEMPEDVGDVCELLAELCEKGVHFLFNTGSPKKSGKAPSLFIQGLAEDWPDEPQEGAGEAEARTGGKPSKGKPKEEAEETTEEEPEASEEGEGDGGDTDAETTESAEEPWIPAKGDIYFYTPPKGKKTKVEVTAVDLKKKTFDLKGGKPPKIYKAVKWWKDKAETEASVEGEE